MELTEEHAKHILDFVAKHFGYDKLDIVKKNKWSSPTEYKMMMSKKTKNEYFEDQLVIVLWNKTHTDSYSVGWSVKRSYAQCLLELIERHARVVPLSKMIDFDVPSFKFPETLEEMCILSDINSPS